MTLHPLCCEELIQLGAIDHIFRIIQKSQKSQRDDTKQVLLKTLRNLSRWTKFLQCRLQVALELQDVTPLLGVAKDPASYIHTAEEEGVGDDVVSQTSLYWEKHFWDMLMLTS